MKKSAMGYMEECQGNNKIIKCQVPLMFAPITTKTKSDGWDTQCSKHKGWEKKQ